MRVLFLAGVLGALTSACVGGPDSCFRPPSIVDDSRVLAVRSDPPDQFVDLDGTTAPTVRARALFAGVGAETAVKLGGFLCAPTDDLRCPPGSLAVPTGAAVIAAEAETTFTVPLELIAAARDADPLLGYGGIRVQLDAIGFIGPREIHVGKVLLFQTDPAVIPNGAIELTSVELNSSGLPTQSGTPTSPLDTGVSVVYGVRPRVVAGAGASEAAEQYTVVNLSGRTVTLRERISYSFFTTQELIYGDLTYAFGNPEPVYVAGADIADEPPPGSPEPDNGLVRLTPLQKADTHLWVVARDGRGAVAWTWAVLEVTDERECPCSDLRIVCDASQ